VLIFVFESDSARKINSQKQGNSIADVHPTKIPGNKKYKKLKIQAKSHHQTIELVPINSSEIVEDKKLIERNSSVIFHFFLHQHAIDFSCVKSTLFLV
jgi:hypothetical protein